MHFGFLIFDDIQQLDLTAPYEVFMSAPEAKVSLIHETLAPVTSSSGLKFFPTATYDDCGKLDVLCIPGGKGINQILQNPNAIAFIAEKAKDVRFITSVCTGSLALGMAGLLKGKKATSHWTTVDFLPAFGAIPSRERVVRDGNIFTAGGVTSGIDFGLTLIAELYDTLTAQKIALSLQYAPKPPFHSGTPEEAPQNVLEAAQKAGKKNFEERRAIIEAWKTRI